MKSSNENTISPSKLKMLRVEKGWSQEKLAAVSGLSLRTIQRIEKDGQCSVESKLAITAALNIAPSELLADYLEEVGDGSVNVGGVVGAISIASLCTLVIAWEWDDLSMFVNPVNALFVYLTVFSLSMITSGFKPSYQALSTLSWLFIEPKQALNAQDNLPVLRRMIFYCYTSGIIWTLTEVVEVGYFASQQTQGQGLTSLSEIGYAMQSMLYAVLLAEFVLRPLMNRINWLLTKRY